MSVRDAYNADLVQLKHGFPAAALERVGKSYCKTVGLLRASPIVMSGLAKSVAQEF